MLGKLIFFFELDEKNNCCSDHFRWLISRDLNLGNENFFSSGVLLFPSRFRCLFSFHSARRNHRVCERRSEKIYRWVLLVSHIRWWNMARIDSLLITLRVIVGSNSVEKSQTLFSWMNFFHFRKKQDRFRNLDLRWRGRRETKPWFHNQGGGEARTKTILTYTMYNQIQTIKADSQAIFAVCKHDFVGSKITSTK